MIANPSCGASGMPGATVARAFGGLVKSFSLLVLALAATSLSAQEISDGLRARVILFEESIQTRSLQLAPGVSDQADRQAGTGLRLMGALGDEARWYWELGGRFPSSARMVTNRDIATAPPANNLDATGVKIYYSYWSAGAGYLLPLGPSVDLGLHLEGRAETINPKGTYVTTAGGAGFMDAHTVYWRPWIRLSLDVKLKTGSFTTVVGAEAGVATLKTNQDKVVPLSVIDANTMKALAPTWSGAVYAGIQF